MIVEERQVLTETGPGTLGGELLRRYWHPVAGSGELTAQRPTKRVRLLGENLVVFRDLDGTFGLFDERCVHWGRSLSYGGPEDGGFRCPFHSWLFDKSGKVLEAPPEPKESVARFTLRQRAFPVQRARGLLFAYLGPLPAPPLPEWDVLVRQDGKPKIEIHPVLNCNWLQMQVWGITSGASFQGSFGGNGSQNDGSSLIFPNVLRHASEDGSVGLFFRGPVDDAHTRTIWLGFESSADGSIVEEEPDPPPAMYMAMKDEEDFFYIRGFPRTYSAAWGSQGPIRDAGIEHLSAADEGVAAWRQLLRDNIDKVRRGEDPVRYELN